jgi:hypothetical protein
MKKILLPILLLLAIVSFAYPQKKRKKMKPPQPAITKVVFESVARGNNAAITFTKDSAISIGRRHSKYILLSAKDWSTITNSVKKIKLADIPKWEAPTKAREYDGATHCTISVSTKNSQYQSQTFDGGQPMKQLQALYNAIDSLRNKINEDGKTYTTE